MPHSIIRGHSCIGLSLVLALLCTTTFSRTEFRAISDLRVKLVPLNLLKLSKTCISFADSSKAVQILLIIFHVFMLSSPGDILC